MSAAIVRPYECSMIPEWITSEGPYRKTIMALSASKARYLCLLGLRDAGWSPRFQDIRVRSVNSVPVAVLQDFARVAKYRGLEFARIGMKVEVEGHPGVIVGKNDSANFDVCFTSGKHRGAIGNCHPTWMMKYFGKDGTVLAEFGAAGNSQRAHETQSQALPGIEKSANEKES